MVQPIYATAEGIVSLAKYSGALGNCIVIKHKFGYETLYGHLDEILVVKSQEVKKREVIGTMGRSGNITGTHIHYQVSLNRRPQNPERYFK